MSKHTDRLTLSSWCLPCLKHSSEHFAYINAGDLKNHTLNFHFYYFHFEVKQIFRDNTDDKWYQLVLKSRPSGSLIYAPNCYTLLSHKLLRNTNLCFLLPKILVIFFNQITHLSSLCTVLLLPFFLCVPLSSNSCFIMSDIQDLYYLRMALVFSFIKIYQKYRFLSLPNVTRAGERDFIYTEHLLSATLMCFT